MSNPKVHVLTCSFCPCASELIIKVTIRKESNMLGVKAIPPKRGIRHLWTFLLFGISYRFLSLQKLSSMGININPHSVLITNAPMMGRISCVIVVQFLIFRFWVTFIAVLYICITDIFNKYCMVIQKKYLLFSCVSCSLC